MSPCRQAVRPSARRKGLWPGGAVGPPAHSGRIGARARKRASTTARHRSAGFRERASAGVARPLRQRGAWRRGHRPARRSWTSWRTRRERASSPVATPGESSAAGTRAGRRPRRCPHLPGTTSAVSSRRRGVPESVSVRVPPHRQGRDGTRSAALPGRATASATERHRAPPGVCGARRASAGCGGRLRDAAGAPTAHASALPCRPQAAPQLSGTAVAPAVGEAHTER